jgi:hypothetical protein
VKFLHHKKTKELKRTDFFCFIVRFLDYGNLKTKLRSNNFYTGDKKMTSAVTKNRFAGIIMEKSELNELTSTGKAVINLVVAKTEEIIAGIKEQIEARVVLFGPLAARADAELEEGKVVMFNVQKNPRIYVTEKGTRVETVDLVARGYTVLTKTQYEKAKDQIEAMSFSANDLIFTDEDREAATKQLAESDASVA